MPKCACAAAMVLLLWPVMWGAGQTSGSTRLMLQVAPESRLDPQHVLLQFRVSADGASDVTSVPAVIRAGVRPSPGQTVRITGHLVSLTGPAGPVPVSQVRWTGSAVSASGGAREASCSSGSFESGTAQDMVVNWQTSGMLTCSVTFELTEPRSLPAGLYAGTVNLALPGQ